MRSSPIPGLLFDQYPNTPGFVGQIQDGGLKVANPPTIPTQSVLLFGVATDGPSNTPVPLQSLSQGEQIFGITTNVIASGGSLQFNRSLTRGMYEAFLAGCTDIRLCRVGGTAAVATLVASPTSQNISLAANWPGVKYNGLSYTVTTSGSNGTLTITTLDGTPHAFAWTATSLVQDLLNAVNNSGINISASVGFAASAGILISAAPLATAGTTSFAGGLDGTNLTDAQYSDALTAAYALVENYPVDIYVPLGAYLQPTLGLDASGNPTIVNNASGDTVYFGQNLAQLCARASVNTHSCVGVIDIGAPLGNPTYAQVVAQGKALALTGYNFNYMGPNAVNPGGYTPAAGPAGTAQLDVTGNAVPIGYLLNITCGPDFILNNTRVGNYIMDPAATYAGKITSLQPQSATTNKTIGSVLGLTFAFGASVVDNVTAQKFVTFLSTNGVVKVVADQTYAANGSDFTKLSTLRTTYAALEAVRNATSQYIGEAATPQAINAMGTSISSALKQMKANGALLDFSFQIVSSAADQINGNTKINLILVPALQIRKIYVTTSLRPPSDITVSG